MVAVAGRCLPVREIFCVFLSLFIIVNSKYEPNWKSIDSRPLPAWYDEVKFGIFLTWGIYSVPSFRNEWFWWHWQGGKAKAYVDFMTKNYPPDFTYPDFAQEFKAEFFDPDKWAEIIAASGAKYLVLTSKHHEGYTNWPSSYSWNWNSMDVGPKRDLVGDLAAAIRNKTDIHFGLYHSLYEWFHPQYLADKANNYRTNKFVSSKTLPELYEIVTKYKPEVIWSDGDWEAPDTYWNSTEFIAWLYNKSPVKDVVVTNDRWGRGIMCHHGGYLTCSDKYNPGVLQKRKWENAMTVDRQSWGYRRDAQMPDILTIEQILETMTKTISCGGNLLMNVGPTADGRIIPVFEERLRQTGDWLKVNGEAIYKSKPWVHQNDTVNPNVWYTSKKSSSGTSVYAIVLKWPSNGLTLGAPVVSSTTKIQLLGYPGTFSFEKNPSGGITIKVPAIRHDKMPCKWAWVFKLENLANERK